MPCRKPVESLTRTDRLELLHVNRNIPSSFVVIVVIIGLVGHTEHLIGAVQGDSTVPLVTATLVVDIELGESTASDELFYDLLRYRVTGLEFAYDAVRMLAHPIPDESDPFCYAFLFFFETMKLVVKLLDRALLGVELFSFGFRHFRDEKVTLVLFICKVHGIKKVQPG